MEKDDIVETKCLIKRNGAMPIKLEGFNDRYIIGLMKAVKLMKS